MKRASVVILKILLLLTAIASCAILIRFPQTEGRAANLDIVSIYSDPVIIYMYIASIPFFVALYKAYTLLGYYSNNTLISPAATGAVKNIKYCALALIGFMIGAEAYLFIVERSKSDDPAGGIAMGIFIILISSIVASAAAILQKYLSERLLH